MKREVPALTGRGKHVIVDGPPDTGATMPSLRVMLLGGFEARLVSGAPVSLPTRKAQALLAYLGVRPGQS